MRSAGGVPFQPGSWGWKIGALPVLLPLPVGLPSFGLLVAVIFGKCRLECFKRHLETLVEQQDWCQLYATKTSALEFGIWRPAAQGALETQKAEVKTRSFQLGISLQYVFEELKAIYQEKALEAEWRLDTLGPATRSSYFVNLRNRGEDVPDREAAWNDLLECPASEDPNFHQVAGLMAYGPLALGRTSTALVMVGWIAASWMPWKRANAVVEPHGSSPGFGATNFPRSWAPSGAGWNRHHDATGDVCGDVYIWWCVMVNNQFRMLEEGQTAETTNLFDVFGRQLAGIGKMLMCLDKIKGGTYTTRIWCIFEVFVACRHTIPPPRSYHSWIWTRTASKPCRNSPGNAGWMRRAPKRPSRRMQWPSSNASWRTRDPSSL